MAEHEYLKSVVEFVPVGNVQSMVDAVASIIDGVNKEGEFATFDYREREFMADVEREDFYSCFYRFMNSVGWIDEAVHSNLRHSAQSGSTQ